MSKSNFKRAVVSTPKRSKDVSSSLHNAQIVISRPVLTAEIISAILEYLPIPDLMRFSRVSRRMKDMVYDDTRWISKLQLIGCWNETEARIRFEDSLRETWEAKTSKISPGSKTPDGETPKHERPDSTIFDANMESRGQKTEETSPAIQSKRLLDKFGVLALAADSGASTTSTSGIESLEKISALTVISSTKSTRGAACQAFARIYGCLAPYYLDISRSLTHTGAKIFRDFPEPEQQAQILFQLTSFAHCDVAEGWAEREDKLSKMVDMFETAVLREFDQGFEAGDISGRTRRYATVLNTLNGGQAGIDHFLRKHPIFETKRKFGDALDCFKYAFTGSMNLAPSIAFFEKLELEINEQSLIIEKVFPRPLEVFEAFIGRISDSIVSEYITPLLDEAHQRSLEAYLKATPSLYDQTMRLVRKLRIPGQSTPEIYDKLVKTFSRIFESHVDLYLQEELQAFRSKSTSEVSEWERKLSEQDASTESFFMSNVNRQADKRDFLSSFKKVVMMPVNVVAMPFAGSKSSLASSHLGEKSHPGLSPHPTRSSTPSLDERSASPAPEAPTTELAAKAAIMNSKLEGIRSLFSLEIALNLVHMAKSSLERVALFVKLGGQYGEISKEQCGSIFVHLVQLLGTRHIKAGFDKAVEHLSNYKPREVSEHNQSGVAPLVMFLELVNVGDLIQQMIDVFYEQELIATRLVDRNDFLDPSVKEKKRFEQVLDERVAAGLNKGIDVLMDEVEYLCATIQTPTDYNPLPGSKQDLGPSETAIRIVELVSAHTKMLIGSTDKHMLDVFNQEVGLQLFAALCKHIKRQRVSIDGAMILISDMTHYFGFIETLRNANLLTYFRALRELAQIYLIGPEDAKEMAAIIADADRFSGVFGAEEAYEFAQRRADWYQVKGKVEKAMYGVGCMLM
ncbi:MAG: F-box protein: endocytic membrane traffic, recycling ReCYcling 1 [Vezdaea aestivalis]|nr:MAG: F-box protein: endocytic membrane traffic, recycling ReCYcling 1 [Vezdaea aestivalis]